MPKYKVNQVLAYNKQILKVRGIYGDSGYYFDTIGTDKFLIMQIWYKFDTIDRFAIPLNTKDWEKAAKCLSLVNSAISAYNRGLDAIVNQYKK